MYRATAEYHVRVRIQSLTKHTPSVYISYGDIFWETELYKSTVCRLYNVYPKYFAATTNIYLKKSSVRNVRIIADPPVYKVVVRPTAANFNENWNMPINFSSTPSHQSS
jgi:hypothetical protein